MSIYKKHMLIALTASIAFVLFNIVAVTSGSAETYYANIDKLLRNIDIMHFR